MRCRGREGKAAPIEIARKPPREASRLAAGGYPLPGEIPGEPLEIPGGLPANWSRAMEKSPAPAASTYSVMIIC